LRIEIDNNNIELEVVMYIPYRVEGLDTYVYFCYIVASLYYKV